MLSEFGLLQGSDLVTARLVDGKVKVEDRHADFVASAYTETGSTKCLAGACLFPGLTAKLDSRHDWTIISGSRVNNTQEFVMSRLLNTTDKQDRPIEAGQTRILWAWGSGTAVGYHSGNRGVGVIEFYAKNTVLSAAPALLRCCTHSTPA